MNHERLALVRFLIVGGLGTITNLAIFFILVDLQHWNPTVGAVIAFVASAAQNYILNHYWTFARQVAGAAASVQGYARYLTVALVALGVNLAVLWAVIALFDPPWKVIAQAAGILGGTAINYLGSKHWVFKTRE